MFMVFKIISSDYFQIDAIRIIGSRSVPAESIRQDLSDYNSRSIFIVNSKEISNGLLQKHSSFKRVSVAKIWPDKLIINITEKQPLLFYINLNGVYLIDEDGKVSEILFQDKINFETEQLNVITGAEGIDSRLVSERLAAEHLQTQESIPEDERTDFDISAITPDKKFEVLNTIRTELLEQSRAIILSYKTRFDPASYPPLQTVFAFENSSYAKGSVIDEKRIGLTREVTRFFDQRNETIQEIVWEGKFLVRVTLQSGKTCIFGTNRNISEQLEDYIVITQQLAEENKNYSEMDLSSRKVSVK